MDELKAAVTDPAVGLPPQAQGNPEGYLFPATYEFEPDESATTVLKRLVDAHKRAVSTLGIAAEQEPQVLTKASIIQAEARSAADMRKVARVIQNRLDRGTSLQMDSTVHYATNNSEVVTTTQEERQIDSAYNTYKYPGLPPGPINSPGGHQGRARPKRGRVPPMVAGQRLNQNPAGAGDVQRCAVLGSPIGHSRSPVLHRAAYVALGLNWQYEAYDVTVEQLPGFLAGLDSSWRGLSITMPLKQAVKSYVHETSLLADLLDSVNTVLLSWPDAEQPSPWMYGENTDVLGMVAAVRELWVDDDHPGLRGCVLGAGATARSALAALVELGCRQVQVVVRRPPAAAHLHDLADRLGLQLQVQDWAAAWDGIAAADVVISWSITPGRHGWPRPCRTVAGWSSVECRCCCIKPRLRWS